MGILRDNRKRIAADRQAVPLRGPAKGSQRGLKMVKQPELNAGIRLLTTAGPSPATETGSFVGACSDRAAGMREGNSVGIK